MNQFKDFNIKPEITSLVGDKINISRVLNREITVTNYTVRPSLYEKSENCLWLEFQLKGNKHVLFTSGTILIQQIEKVPKESFPFNATIIKENEYYEFT